MKKNNLQRSILFGFLAWIFPLGLAFVATPIVVHGLGAEEYGLYALILGFISYSFAFNIGRAVTKYVSEYLSKGQNELVGEVLSAALILNLIVGLGGAGVLVLLTPNLVINVLQIEPHLQSKAAIAFYIAATTMSLWMVGQVFSSVLQAVGRFDTFSQITSVSMVFFVGGNLYLVWNGYGLVSLFWWNLLINGVTAAVFYFIARKMLPEAGLSLFCRGEMLRMVAKFSAGIIAYQILGNILLVFERSVITRNFGTESLTYYVVPMTLATYIHNFVTSLSVALMPLTSEVGANKQAEYLEVIYTRATKYIALVVVFFCLALGVGSRAFLGLWLGAEFAARSGSVFIFHVLTCGMMAVGIVAWQTTDGLGFPARNAFLVLSWLLLGAPLMVLAAPVFGLEGLAASRAAGVLFTVPIFILIVEKQTFGKYLWTFWRNTALSLVCAGGAGGFAQYFLLRSLPQSWFGFILATGASGLIYLGFLFAIGYFPTDEQRWLRQFAGRAVAAP